MSLARPFDGYLPRPDLAARVVAPPYDSATVGQHHAEQPANPLSFLNVVRSEVDHPGLDGAARRDLLRQTAKRLLDLLASGAYVHYAAPAYFVCRLEQAGHAQVGVVADVPLRAYQRGVVKVHELTRRGQEDRLVEYMESVRANFLPVFLVHPPASAVDRAVAGVMSRAPAMDFAADDGLRITMWVVQDPAEVGAVAEALTQLEVLYVADGHHRAAAAARYATERHAADPGSTGEEPWAHLLSVLFPADQLEIHAYHRCLADLNGLTAGEFLEVLGGKFDVEALAGAAAADARPRERGEVTMRLDGGWYRIGLGEPAGAGVASLDVTLLHDRILAPLLGVADARTDPRLEFVPGTLGLGELERLCGADYAVGFALHPMAVDELFAVADRGEAMPPKSTWFAPKLPSGLVIRLL